MKKVLILLLIAVVSLSAVSAAELDKPLKITQDKAYRPVFINRFNRLAYDLWENPAELADNRFIFDLPEVAVSVNNVADVLSDENCRKSIVDGEYVNVAKDYFKYTGNGTDATNRMVALDLGMGMQIGGFATRFDMNIDMNTYNEKGYSSLISANIIPEINLAASFGYGMTILKSNLLTLKAGASVHPTLRMFTKAISADKAISAFSSGTDYFLDEYGDFYVGWAVPVDASVSVGFLNDQLRAYAQANNMFGQYHYQEENYEDITSDISSIIEAEDTFDAGHFELDIGCYYEPKGLKIVSPSAYFEFADVYDLVKEAVEDESFEVKDFLPHLNFGVDVELFNIVQVGFAYKDGYRQLGLGVGLNDIRVQAFYGAKEYNNNVADTLSVVVKLGWDKN